MHIRIESDWSEVDRELDRLETLPGPEDSAKMDAVLHAQHIAVLAAIHVQSGALASSLKQTSKSGRHTWEGELEVGGKGTGVDYAYYEQRRGIGGAGGPSDARGDHDFMDAAVPYEELMADVVEEILGG